MTPEMVSVPKTRPSGQTLFRVMLAFIIVAGWVSAWILPWEKIFPVKTCLFRRLTGLPCPFCDLTHACVFMAHGRISEALFANPLGPVLMLVSLVALAVLLALLVLKSPPIDLDSFYKKVRWFRPALAAAWCLNWFLMILRAL